MLGWRRGGSNPDLLTASQALSQLSYAPCEEVLYGNSPPMQGEFWKKSFRGRAPGSRGVATAEASTSGAGAGARPGRRGPSMPG